MLVAGVVMVGFVAAISLLLRHWQAIEQYTHVMAQTDLTSPLLQVCMLTYLCICVQSTQQPATACLV